MQFCGKIHKMANKNKTFILHDQSVNTHGFRMLTSGADLTEFYKNPVLLLNHDDWIMPIGRWENIRIEGDKILADAVFDMNDARAAEVARKVGDDFVRAASIGAWVDETSSDPLLRLPGQTEDTVTKWTVREASICTIGANHNALALYDRTTNARIDLSDKGAVVKLMSAVKNEETIYNNTSMGKLNFILGLSDQAAENEQVAKVQTLMSDVERLKKENATLKDSIDQINKAKKDAQRAEAIALVDAAVKDGRLDATGKENFLALFDKDFVLAKQTLSAIPKRASVAGALESGPTTDLSDFKNKSWDELDKAEKLTALRDKDFELYKAKFKERFGVEYKEK